MKSIIEKLKEHRVYKYDEVIRNENSIQDSKEYITKREENIVELKKEITDLDQAIKLLEAETKDI